MLVHGGKALGSSAALGSIPEPSTNSKRVGSPTNEKAQR